MILYLGDVHFLRDIQNLAIERDGEQHFEPIGFGSSDVEKIQKKFQKIQERDKRKNEWCKDNNYHLLRISYKTKFEDYHDIIVEFLKESEQHQGQGFIKLDKFYDELLNPKDNEDEDLSDDCDDDDEDDYVNKLDNQNQDEQQYNLDDYVPTNQQEDQTYNMDDGQYTKFDEILLITPKQNQQYNPDDYSIDDEFI